MSSCAPEAQDPSGFLAPLGMAQDWRIVVALDTLRRTGLLDGLPVEVGVRAQALGLDGTACVRLLRLLSRVGIVSLDNGVVSAGAAFPDADGLQAMGQHANAIRQWSAQLDDRVRGRRPADDAALFDRESWLRNMAAGAARSADSVADLVLAHAPGAVSVLELGGGHGEYGRAFARRGLRVSMLDRPEIVELVRSAGWLANDPITLVAGDFHEGLPEGPFDIVLCFGINHGFGEQQNRALFRRVAAVLSDAGAVAVSTTLAGAGERADLFAVHMLANRSDGDAHAETSYRDWLGDAGLTLDSVEPLDDRGRFLLLGHKRLAGHPGP